MGKLVPIGFLFLIGCTAQLDQETNQQAKVYLNDVGDIPFQPETDRMEFSLCNAAKLSTSRRGLTYFSDKELSEVCKDAFRFSDEFASFSGFITVRFLVNCNGETDRFRSESMDFSFTEIKAPVALEDHLIDLVKGLNKWAPSQDRYEGMDFAKYLNFKIVNGRLTDVLQ